MFRPRNRAVGAALLMVVILVLAACSATGGKRAAEQPSQIVAAGHASTPHYTIAMITHAGPGQSLLGHRTLWRRGRGDQGQLHPQVLR